MTRKPGNPHLQHIFNSQAPELQSRLIALTLIGKNGMEIDKLTLDMNDSDGRIEVPGKGATPNPCLICAGRNRTAASTRLRQSLC